MHNDKYDKTNFIKNILADSILPGDVFMKSKEMHMTYDSDRIVFVLHYDEIRGVDVYDIVNGMFPDNGKDFVIDLDNNMVVVVREVRFGITHKEIEEIAKQIADTVSGEAMVNIRVGIGSVASNIKDIAKSYKEAQVALEVGKVFDGEKNIISYDYLGIARLIYQLPTTLCELFLTEVFQKGLNRFARFRNALHNSRNFLKITLTCRKPRASFTFTETRLCTGWTRCARLQGST